MSIKPEFFALSYDCPAICTLYELLDGADPSQPTLLPQASDPSFVSFDQFTGELVIATSNANYAGNEINLIVECAASRQYGGYFSYPLQIRYNIPNGCTVQFNSSTSTIQD